MNHLKQETYDHTDLRKPLFIAFFYCTLVKVEVLTKSSEYDICNIAQTCAFENIKTPNSLDGLKRKEEESVTVKNFNIQYSEKKGSSIERKIFLEMLKSLQC